jgi:hypothetical protein
MAALCFLNRNTIRECPATGAGFAQFRSCWNRLFFAVSFALQE